MLTTLKLRPLSFTPPATLPPFVRPLIMAAAEGKDLVPILVEIAKHFGFDNFTHGISLSAHPNADSHSFVFTTLPAEWTALYDQKSYLEVDPRIDAGIRSTLPFVWDQRSLRGKSASLDAFLTDAAKYGVCSGVSIGIRDAHGRGGMSALTSARRALARRDRSTIANQISDIISLGQYFHELVVMAILEQDLPPLARGAPLSKRERQCLVMAANGLTSAEIAPKLGIAERTVNFHFCNVLTKLNALNRKEAVARAVSQRLIHLES